MVGIVHLILEDEEAAATPQNIGCENCDCFGCDSCDCDCFGCESGPR